MAVKASLEGGTHGTAVTVHQRSASAYLSAAQAFQLEGLCWDALLSAHRVLVAQLGQRESYSTYVQMRISTSHQAALQGQRDLTQST